MIDVEGQPVVSKQGGYAIQYDNKTDVYGILTFIRIVSKQTFRLLSFWVGAFSVYMEMLIK